MKKQNSTRKLQAERLGDRLLMAADTVAERPISDWLDAQQDTGAWGNDADVNRDGLFGSSPADQDRFRIQFDWFGLQNEEYGLGLDTQITGTVRERQIGDVDGDGDDDVLVTVDLHAENVNIYIQDRATRTVLFGDNPTDDVAHDAALATIDFRLDIIVDEMGAPLPSWGPFASGSDSLLEHDFLIPGNELPHTQQFQLNVNAEGTLTDAGAEYFDVDPGTKAKMHWGKPGLYEIPPVGDDKLEAFGGNGQNRGAGRIYPSSGFVFQPLGGS